MIIAVLHDVITRSAPQIANQFVIAPNRQQGGFKKRTAGARTAESARTLGLRDARTRRSALLLESAVQKSFGQPIAVEHIGAHLGNDRQIDWKPALQKWLVEPLQIFNRCQGVGVIIA